jgi:hypothetical protein
MKLTSVTYTSLARIDGTSELEDIETGSREWNARNDVTGFMIYNGTHFLQLIEGAETVIDDLVDRVRQDPRHTGFEIRDRQKVDRRSFPGWPLEVVRVNASYFEARDTIADRLPDTVPEAIRARLLRITELISTIEFPN